MLWNYLVRSFCNLSSVTIPPSQKWLFSPILDVYLVNIQGILWPFHKGRGMVENEDALSNGVLCLKNGDCLDHLLQQNVIVEVALSLVLQQKLCLLPTMIAWHVDFCFSMDLLPSD